MRAIRDAREYSKGLMFVLLGGSLLLSACAGTPGPDKSFAGMLLGAGWGAGAGAVIGHQVNAAGSGSLIGMGFGAASGLLTGIALDVAEGTDLEQQRELDALKVQIAANHREITRLQEQLDNREQGLLRTPTSIRVFFDRERASLRSGSVVELQRLADAIKFNPYIGVIEVHGHTDETGDTEKNSRLSEARARTVATFLGNNGVSMDRIKVFSHGATRPLTSNETEAGRQLNRRAEVVLLK